MPAGGVAGRDGLDRVSGAEQVPDDGSEAADLFIYLFISLKGKMPGGGFSHYGPFVGTDIPTDAH